MTRREAILTIPAVAMGTRGVPKLVPQHFEVREENLEWFVSLFPPGTIRRNGDMHDIYDHKVIRVAYMEFTP